MGARLWRPVDPWPSRGRYSVGKCTIDESLKPSVVHAKSVRSERTIRNIILD